MPQQKQTNVLSAEYINHIHSLISFHFFNLCRMKAKLLLKLSVCLLLHLSVILTPNHFTKNITTNHKENKDFFVLTE